MNLTAQQLGSTLYVKTWFVKEDVAANAYYYPADKQQREDLRPEGGRCFQQPVPLSFRLYERPASGCENPVYAVDIDAEAWRTEGDPAFWGRFGDLERVAADRIEQRLAIPAPDDEGAVTQMMLAITCVPPEGVAEDPFRIELFRKEGGEWISIGHANFAMR
jgi:hypothetical protein